MMYMSYTLVYMYLQDLFGKQDIHSILYHAIHVFSNQDKKVLNVTISKLKKSNDMTCIFNMSIRNGIRPRMWQMQYMQIHLITRLSNYRKYNMLDDKGQYP